MAHINTFQSHWIRWLTLLLITLRVSAAQTADTVNHRCFPLKEGVLLKLNATEQNPHSVLFYHSVDALFTEVPIDLFPMSTVGPYLPLVTRLKGGEYTNPMVCTPELFKTNACQVLTRFIVSGGEMDSTFYNDVLTEEEVMRIKDTGVWCMLYIGDGTLGVSFEDDGEDAYVIRASFVMLCAIVSVVINNLYAFKKRNDEDDAMYPEVKNLLNWICYYQGVKLIHLSSDEGTILSYHTWLAQIVFNVMVYHYMYKFCTSDSIIRGRILFYVVVVLKNLLPVVQPVLELFVWYKLMYNYKKLQSPSLDGDVEKGRYYHHRRFPRLVIRCLFTLYFFQATVLHSHAFWDTMMFDNGYKSFIEKYLVLFAELKVLMLFEGGLLVKTLVLMDESTWCLVVALFAYVW